MILLPLLLLAACPHPQPVVDWASIPHLPSPEAGTYARVPASPQDPVVASLVAAVRWDASLSGAAAGLALAAIHDDGGLTEAEVREAAWRAGYPHPVVEVRGWSAPREDPPPPELTAWLAQRTPDEDVGLVRARAAGGDAWVGLVARPTLDLGALPRQVEDVLVLPPLEATYRLFDPAGGLTAGGLSSGLSHPVAEQGEWLLEIDQGDLVLVLPFYAGVSPPREPLVPSPTAIPPGDPASWGRLLMDDVRVAFDLPGWTWVPALDQAAAALLDDPSVDPAEAALAGGFLAGELVRRECEAATVEDCVARWAWEPPLRPVFLAEGAPSAGLAARPTADGVRLGVLVAR